MGGIGRFLGPGQLATSTAAGSVELALDLQAIPTPTALASVQAGQSWIFQGWYRDGMAGSNFTEAVRVEFL